MAWVKLDDAMINHPKIEAIGVVGMGLHCAALCYANQHLTDGFISETRVPLLICMEDVDRRWDDSKVSLDHPSLVWAAILVDAGVWDKVERGYQIHNYLKYQPSRREVEKERAKRRAVRVASGQQGGKQTASKRTANVQQSGQQTSSPVARIPDIPVPPAAAATAREEPTPHQRAYRAVENLTGQLNRTVVQAVDDALEGTEPEWVEAACEEAALNNGRSWKYVAAILDRWKRDGFKADRRQRNAGGTGQRTDEFISVFAEELRAAGTPRAVATERDPLVDEIGPA